MIYTTKEVAAMVGLSVRRVQEAAPAIAQKLGRDYAWDDAAIEKLKKRKGKRGNPTWKKRD